MIAGAVTLVIMLVLRIAAIIAAVFAGLAMLGLPWAYGAWASSPTAAHWHALMKSMDLITLCMAVTMIGLFGPMWVFSKPNPVRPRYRA